MRVRFNKKALRFLEKLDKKKEEKIHSMLKKVDHCSRGRIDPICRIEDKKNLKENGRASLECVQMVLESFIGLIERVKRY